MAAEFEQAHIIAYALIYSTDWSSRPNNMWFTPEWGNILTKDNQQYREPRL